MSFKPYTEKIKNKKNLNLFGSGSRTGPGSGSIIPEADPKHWKVVVRGVVAIHPKS